MKKLMVLIGLLAALTPVPARAGEADAEKAEIVRTPDGLYRIDLTVRHADRGWEHYADRWEVLAPDGTVLGVRTLFHPHDNEQPFTRSLSRVVIPRSVSRVTLRAHDKIHGFGGKEIIIAVPR
jgi:hypothetical protein